MDCKKRMKFLGQLITSLAMMSLIAPSFALELPAEDEPAGESAILELEGKSFQGRIRAKGVIGLFSVKGTLSFKDGLLVWSAKGSEDSAPYETEEMDGVSRFTSRVPGKDGGHVEWTGAYDGEAVSDVKAIWTRAEEDDFFHNLFLPDVVTLVFKEDTD